MSEYNYNNNNQQYQYQQPVPNNTSAGRGSAIASMVLGIMSICGSWSTIPSIIMAIVGLILSGKASAAGNTSAFTKVGKITSIVGLIMGILAVVVVILYVVLIFVVGVGGALASGMDW